MGARSWSSGCRAPPPREASGAGAPPHHNVGLRRRGYRKAIIMFARIGALFLGCGLLAACARNAPALPDGSLVLDEPVALTRANQLDSASRGFTVDGDSIVVAFV